MGKSLRVAIVVMVTATVVLGVTAQGASASMLIAHDIKHVHLKVNKKSTVALVNYKYKKNGKWKQRHMLAWGAKNWPKAGKKFKIDRTGGWKTGGKYGDWKTFKNHCKKYRGPKIPYAVRKCSVKKNGVWHHWAIQKWQRIKPNYGGKRGKVDFRLSHWTGMAKPKLKVWADWAGNDDCFKNDYCAALFGTYTYKGKPVIGGAWTKTGYVLDGEGRNVTLEAKDPDYGNKGWVRVNMFLAHKPSGQFCYVMRPKPQLKNLKGLTATQKKNLTTKSGRSKVNKYRMASAGPGVLPDVNVAFTGFAKGKYNAELDERLYKKRRKLAGYGPKCRHK